MTQADAAPGEITQLLKEWAEGDGEAPQRVFPLVYQHLRRMARAQLGRRPPGDTLAPTGLVHEAYLKLVDPARVSLNDRQHFYAVAARAMRQILVDHARRRGSLKRGGMVDKTALDEGKVSVEERAQELVALDEALGSLEVIDPRLAQIVELRFFGGLSISETAELLCSSTSTVKRDWSKARAFLYDAMSR